MWVINSKMLMESRMFVSIINNKIIVKNKKPQFLLSMQNAINAKIMLDAISKLFKYVHKILTRFREIPDPVSFDIITF